MVPGAARPAAASSFEQAQDEVHFIGRCQKSLGFMLSLSKARRNGYAADPERWPLDFFTALLRQGDDKGMGARRLPGALA